MKTLITAAAVLSTVSAAGAAAAPPIINPGAPGEPSRTVSADHALLLSRSSYTDADVRFMQHMIVHHAQAVEMGALIEARTDHPGVIAIGERIALTQAAEIELMRTWLAERGEAETDPGLHAHHGHGGGHDHGAHHGHDGHHTHDGGHEMDAPPDTPVMPGMLSPAQMAALAAAEGEAFDRLFLEGMILHHQGALDMVDVLMAEPGSGEDPLLSEFLGGVVADQAAEILRMQSMLAEL